MLKFVQNALSVNLHAIAKDQQFSFACQYLNGSKYNLRTAERNRAAFYQRRPALSSYAGLYLELNRSLASSG